MLTFRIAMTAAVMTFDHRDDQAVPPKTVTAEVNQITDFHWLPLPCSGWASEDQQSSNDDNPTAMAQRLSGKTRMAVAGLNVQIFGFCCLLWPGDIWIRCPTD